jgi:hypothetical protein
MSITFNSTTPAAPAGAAQVQFQKDGSGNVSAYTKGGGKRTTVTLTTQSLTTGQTENQGSGSPIATLTMSQAFLLLNVTVNRPCRVELYQNAAAQAADASRPNTVPPTAGQPHGVILDLYIDATTFGAHPSFNLAPSVPGANLDSPVTDNIAYQITNLDTTTGPVVVTFEFIPIEA